ncbi:MAG TPA: efflux RND transporter periplasmic adaptor subunit [Thermoanaerobaculia bacterium]|nr:efflux RND transporter periplasmic adaptor subunit [Thermoanaerobaculia bacterium]
MKRQVLSSILVLLLAAAGLAAFGCGGSDDADAAKPEPGAATSTTAAPPLPEDVRDVAGVAKEPSAGKGPEAAPASAAAQQPDTAAGGRVVANGELVSPVRSELAVKNPGRVARVYVDEGARVRRGQTLLTLESDYLSLDLKRADADVARAKAAAGEAERDFKRKEDLLAKESVSQAAFDRSRSAYDSALAAVASAEAARDLSRQKLRDAVLVSPITGVVAERRTDVGEHMGESSVAFVVAQTSPIKLRFRLPERYLASLREGQAVRATVDPYPGEVFSGKVTQIGGVVDPATRTVLVETDLPNTDGRLSPGLFARVEIEVNR